MMNYFTCCISMEIPHMVYDSSSKTEESGTDIPTVTISCSSSTADDEDKVGEEATSIIREQATDSSTATRINKIQTTATRINKTQTYASLRRKRENNDKPYQIIATNSSLTIDEDATPEVKKLTTKLHTNIYGTTRNDMEDRRGTSYDEIRDSPSSFY